MAEIRNPVDIETLKPLGLAEEEFVRCLGEGRPCKIGSGELPKNKITSGVSANVIRGELIRFFCYGGDDREYLVRGPSIELHGAYISGEVNLEFALIPYTLCFPHCQFSDSINMVGTECIALYLNGCRLEKGLIADRLVTKRDVFLRDRFHVKEGVRLIGANIGQDLACVGGKFHSPDKNALLADGITVKGNMLLNSEFFAEGEVRLIGANIGGNLRCENGKFCNPGKDALIADGITIGKCIFLNLKFSANGSVRLLDATIGADLVCDSGKFHNPDGQALNADRLIAKGNVFLTEGFCAKGEVRFLSASIGRDLVCQNGEFHNPDKRAFIIDSADIGGGLFWKNIKRGSGIVRLVYTRISVLEDDLDSWEPFKIELHGFFCGHFNKFGDVESRIKWLDRRPEGVNFSRQPYEQTAKTLYSAGDYNNAREILLAMERLHTKNLPILHPHKHWRRIWDMAAGYGYRLSNLVLWAFFIVGFGAIIFHHANINGKIIPHQPVALANMNYQKYRKAEMHPINAVRTAIPDYPGFNPLFYSVDVFVPLFSLHQETFWAPDPGKSDFIWRLTQEKGKFDCWWLLTGWYWLQIMAGWLLTSLLIFYITNLLRPR